MTDHPDKGRRKGRGRVERDQVSNEDLGWIADLRQARKAGGELGPGADDEAPTNLYAGLDSLADPGGGEPVPDEPPRPAPPRSDRGGPQREAPSRSSREAPSRSSREAPFGEAPFGNGGSRGEVFRDEPFGDAGLGEVPPVRGASRRGFRWSGRRRPDPDASSTSELRLPEPGAAEPRVAPPRSAEPARSAEPPRIPEPHRIPEPPRIPEPSRDEPGPGARRMPAAPWAPPAPPRGSEPPLRGPEPPPRGPEPPLRGPEPTSWPV